MANTSTTYSPTFSFTTGWSKVKILISNVSKTKHLYFNPKNLNISILKPCRNCKIYMNWTWTYIHFSVFVRIVKSLHSNFPHFRYFWVKNLPILNWFHMKPLNLRKLGMNGNSQNRTEVKRDSVKCWNVLSRVNFSWISFWLVPYGTPCTIRCDQEGSTLMNEWLWLHSNELDFDVVA